MRKIGYAYSVEKQKILIKRSLRVQSVSMLIVFLVVFAGFGYELADSILFGGFCAIIPNLTFAVCCFRHQGAQSAKKIVANFYFAEMLKFFLVFLLLIISYTLATNVQWLDPVGILAGFIIIYASVILVPYVTK